MDNYEINILRRNGNWKKVKPKDVLLDTIDQNHLQIDDTNTNINSSNLDNNKKDDFLYYINQVNEIIVKLESLENDKTNLKNQLKNYEEEFQSKKKSIDNKIKLMSKEAEMLDKSIGIIKNLKNF